MDVQWDNHVNLHLIIHGFISLAIQVRVMSEKQVPVMWDIVIISGTEKGKPFMSNIPGKGKKKPTAKRAGKWNSPLSFRGTDIDR